VGLDNSSRRQTLLGSQIRSWQSPEGQYVPLVSCPVGFRFNEMNSTGFGIGINSDRIDKFRGKSRIEKVLYSRKARLRAKHRNLFVKF